MSSAPALADRYGAPSPGRRRALQIAVVVVVAAFLGWLGWTIWDQTNPQVTSKLVSYDVVDAHRAEAEVDVRLSDSGVRATCTLRAYAEDHSVVGELAFAPSDGRSTQSVRTERRATSVELLGCTAPGQDRRR